MCGFCNIDNKTLLSTLGDFNDGHYKPLVLSQIRKKKKNTHKITPVNESPFYFGVKLKISLETCILWSFNEIKVIKF